MSSLCRWLACLLIVTSSSSQLKGDDDAKGPSLREVLSDTQQIDNSNSRVRIVWWVPKQYWEVCLRDNKDLTAKQVKNLVEVMGSRLLVAVVDADISPLGAFTYTEEADLRKAIIISDAHGRNYNTH